MSDEEIRLLTKKVTAENDQEAAFRLYSLLARSGCFQPIKISYSFDYIGRKGCKTTVKMILVDPTRFGMAFGGECAGRIPRSKELFISIVVFENWHGDKSEPMRHYLHGIWDAASNCFHCPFIRHPHFPGHMCTPGVCNTFSSNSALDTQIMAWMLNHPHEIQEALKATQQHLLYLAHYHYQEQLANLNRAKKQITETIIKAKKEITETIIRNLPLLGEA